MGLIVVKNESFFQNCANKLFRAILSHWTHISLETGNGTDNVAHGVRGKCKLGGKSFRGGDGRSARGMSLD